MANKTQTIRIESILGGHAPMTHFAAPDQYLTSLGIDPSVTGQSGDYGIGSYGSGLINPMGTYRVTSATNSFLGYPMWITSEPTGNSFNPFYIYCANGSVYTVDDQMTTFTGLADLNDGGTATGNGCAYYDNYIYFARDTTIARYGPLSGTETFTDDYWVGTLGKTALTNTSYPLGYNPILRFPNHFLHRHSDGKLYIADVVDNQGTIHYIKTTKTTVEGDTDAGSTYDAVNVGYKLWPTCMESYGPNLIVAFVEQNQAGTGGQNTRSSVTSAKIAFWDTISQNVNSIIWVEFPDQIITAMKNINGVLYFFSSDNGGLGTRVSRLVGDYTIEEVWYSEVGFAPWPGAVDGYANRLIFGTLVSTPTETEMGAVISLGLGKSAYGNGAFCVHRVTDEVIGGETITALKIHKGSRTYSNKPIVGTTHHLEISSDNENAYASITNSWWSQFYKVGQPFKITKIRIPIIADTHNSYTLQVRVMKEFVDGSRPIIHTIDSATYGNNKALTVVIRPTNLVCQNAFSLGLLWVNCEGFVQVALPITIEYELVNDDTVITESYSYP